MKSKKVIAYQTKKTGAIIIVPTNDEFKQKDVRKTGKLLKHNVSDAELGKAMRSAFKLSD